MPQGKKKVPFSGKAKKMQLQMKRERKACVPLTGELGDSVYNSDQSRVLKINAQPSRASKNKSTRYALNFYQETQEEIKLKKEEAHKTLDPVEKDLEISFEDYFSVDLQFPKRPPWTYEMSPQELDLQEQRYFREYLSKLEEDVSKFSFFELNIETWRQLWRVLELSDVILFIVDIRFPSLMFPPSLYNYVTETLKKSIIVVLNKIDLVPPPVVVAWKAYFTTKFPVLRVLPFTSFPHYNLRSTNNASGLYVCRRKGKMKMAAEGALMLLNICKEIVQDAVDLSSWQQKIKDDMNEAWDGECHVQEETRHEESTSYKRHEMFVDGILTIGCVGFPNAGKSSVLNALMGKKVVSVSKTPGHTKHFQTIFLTSTVKLCDCPGLVFPSKTPKHLQVLMGSFPIAQLREPYSTIKFLAEQVDLIKLLVLQHPDGDEEWCAFDICSAWAQKRGFLTARMARPDTYRAANHILRMALEGKIRFCSYPPDYFEKKDIWENHEEIKRIKWIRWDQDNASAPDYEDVSDSEEEEEDDVTSEDDSNDNSNSSDDDKHSATQGNKFSALSICE